MPATDFPTVMQPESFPDTRLLITEDGKPVDNQFVEKLYRLLTEPLWTSWNSPQGRVFQVLANVGLFFEYKKPPLVPDIMFALRYRKNKYSDERWSAGAMKGQMPMGITNHRQNTQVKTTLVSAYRR